VQARCFPHACTPLRLSAQAQYVALSFQSSCLLNGPVCCLTGVFMSREVNRIHAFRLCRPAERNYYSLFQTMPLTRAALWSVFACAKAVKNHRMFATLRGKNIRS